MKKLIVGDKAPDFKLKDKNEKIYSLSDYNGKWILLYFYPKDNTPGCTIEACSMRDNYDDFKKIKAMVLGVSVDSTKSHEKFVEKYNLPFPLLSDENKEVVNKYGVWGKKKFIGREYMGTFRKSFLINPKGKIAKIYEEIKPALHAQEVINDLKTLLV
ncbi:MAG: thioredoxin-dependent thiol peroxidase [Patescibacteria group bacterium]